jgi:2-keto-4-pentenoate hydratase/2-oxohepta-3-ene-1,7-dioic acid hydratase in catechol pathway
MKLITYSSKGNTPQIGAILDNRIINLHLASGGKLPGDMREFLELGDSGMAAAQDVIASATGGESLDSVKLMSPITNPSKIIAIGLNYMDHVKEFGLDVPEIAIMFCKFPTSIIGPDDDICWGNEITQKVDYEAELAIVIGKTARNVPETDAFDYIAGYTNCNDVSARDLQLDKGDQWIRGKSLDTFCPLGPWLVTKDEVPDPHNLSIKSILNGKVMQNSNTRELIFKIPFLIKYLSEAFTLLPGDVIATGTPSGVGAFRKPPIWLKHGDTVNIEVDGLGQLSNPCVEL